MEILRCFCIWFCYLLSESSRKNENIDMLNFEQILRLMKAFSKHRNQTIFGSGSSTSSENSGFSEKIVWKLLGLIHKLTISVPVTRNSSRMFPRKSRYFHPQKHSILANFFPYTFSIMIHLCCC